MIFPLRVFRLYIMASPVIGSRPSSFMTGYRGSLIVSDANLGKAFNKLFCQLTLTKPASKSVLSCFILTFPSKSDSSSFNLYLIGWLTSFDIESGIYFPSDPPITFNTSNSSSKNIIIIVSPEALFLPWYIESSKT